MKTYNFTLRQMQYVVAVADTLSFRRAAERCNVSQPSLSAQIAEMEAAIGVLLFERDRRGVLITSAGQELVGRARRVLVEADDFVEAANRFIDPLAGTLRIGVIPTIAPYLLPGVVPGVEKRHIRA
jgi:LysR family hydrogen peroxide-inducible transcriptional activator